MDNNYYTWGPSNSTQYLAGVEGDIEHERVFIWDPDISQCQGNQTNDPRCLLTDVFDWERNYWLWILINEVFPNSRIMIHGDLSQYIRDEVRSKYGATKEMEWFKIPSVTGGVIWNHHIHAHISLGQAINLDFNFQEFQEKMNELEERYGN